MRKSLTIIGMLLLVAAMGFGQTADEIIAKYVKKIGGMNKVKAAKTLVRVGKYVGGGGFEAPYRQENKRPGMVREEFSMQGMTGISAHDGKSGWKIEPWNGKKDVEELSEAEVRSIVEDGDFDGPLLDYKEKGNTVKFLGTEPVEGTDAYKLEITLKSGDTHTYFMDTDDYVPIKIEIKRTIRGNEQDFFMTLGDYKEVNGVYYPFYSETGSKGSQYTSKMQIESIEANAPITDDRFSRPPAPATGK